MQGFVYNRAGSAEEAVRDMGADAGHAHYLAGGTTLVDLMRLGVAAPRRLIDVSGIAGLDAITLSPAGDLHLGALCRMSTAADHAALRERFPALSESLWKAASAQLRNMATLGGNLMQRTRCAYFRGTEYSCNKRSPGSGCAALDGLHRGHAVLGTSDACIAVYPGDFGVALAAFDAEVQVIGPQGRRTIALLDLHRLPGATPHLETTLRPTELIVGIRVPASAAARASTYVKVRDRESYAFALASAAVGLSLDGDRVRTARIAVGGVATRPWRAHAAERWLQGRALNPTTAREAAATIFEAATPREHNAYKVRLGIDTVVEALMTARDRAQGAQRVQRATD
ncbi:xanthine dehydrogenase family protein subunit M [Cupriavidus respiraculi]|uniref:Aldehyde oxidoreductase FAD-binding subunit PaoB n=1 Tax=Cupriavidus respiraculi TaxID=195930 RepID=A0ABM8WEX8_9BURK|nr:xanthine dehydrogenase family protein subunit M [Cupriavidus respiraculi]CAG9165649.1 Aldehyde oxidoreductase FAD-binding subunit PaoB [Cupriavidus respiraculi]